MKNDTVGLLSVLHLVLSDQRERGTQDPDCIQLAEMVSTALDYCKTGIKVDMSKLPRFDRKLRPDFLAPSPRVRIHKQDATIEMYKIEDELSDPVKVLDPETRPTQFYETQNVNGKLYRKIDDRAFSENMKRQSHASGSLESSALLEEALDHVLRAMKGIQWENYGIFAQDVKRVYERNLMDTLYTCSLNSAHMMHEIEMVTGFLLGIIKGKQRGEQVANMRRRFSEDVQYTRDHIRMGNDGDTSEALPRSIACFHLAMQEPGRDMGKEGRLLSWKYVAAAVCLEELEKFPGPLLEQTRRARKAE
ncbi:hypothetical protein EJ06DRAFT_557025 [Trichodelitschia bisporula]|uniref:RNA-dependent RNA polymerase n=1 Tax=Trichodelitschia bisporula TaxID=703511 RepID=A0A6G1HVU5_9PEZI|nr:hypothetical protein EJ06DRAFT_557025 [Trichodelitschia bisporula]